MIPSYYDAPDNSEGSGRMRGPDEQTSDMFSYLSPEQRVRQDHPLDDRRRLAGQPGPHARRQLRQRALALTSFTTQWFHGHDTALGVEPDFADLNWSGLDFSPDKYSSLMRTDAAMWTRELAAHDQLFAKLGTKLPTALAAERERLGARLAR